MDFSNLCLRRSRNLLLRHGYLRSHRCAVSRSARCSQGSLPFSGLLVDGSLYYYAGRARRRDTYAYYCSRYTGAPVIVRTCCRGTCACTAAVQPVGEQPIVGGGRRCCSSRIPAAAVGRRLKPVQRSAGYGGRGLWRMWRRGPSRLRRRWRWRRPVVVQTPPPSVPQGFAFTVTAAADSLFHCPRNAAVSPPRRAWPAVSCVRPRRRPSDSRFRGHTCLIIIRV